MAIPNTVDGLIRLRAQCATTCVLACPSRDVSRHLCVDYFSPRDIDALVERGARCLVTRGFAPTGPGPVVAILGTSNLNFLITLCALSRLGYVVLVLSPRLAANAYASLITETNCSALLHTSHHDPIVAECRELLLPSTLLIGPLLSREDLLGHDEQPSFEMPDSSVESLSKAALIIHSSGSTGVPKPIYLSHRRLLETSNNSFSHTTLMTLPLYHTFGANAFYRALAGNSLVILWDWRLPLTAENILAIWQVLQPRIISLVPYTLKLLAESEQGVNALRSCAHVTYHGSICPDELGDRLVSQGVHLVCDFGSTETGVLGTSMRPAGDNTWNYIRFLPVAKPFLQMQPSGSLFELVVLDGLKTKTASDGPGASPPHSFRTRDLWAPHPCIPALWKPMGRLDDRITLLNGEKVLPLPIEGRLRQCVQITEAVVFGVGREVPGLLLFRSPDTKVAEMSDRQVVDCVMPFLHGANHAAEGFSQIGREMVVVAPPGAEFPRTDKGSIKRLQGYAKFSQIIDAAYNRLEAPAEGRLHLEGPQMLDHLMNLCKEQIGLKVMDVTEDLFAAGLDSSKAIRFAYLIKRDVDSIEKPSQKMIYEAGNVRNLAHRLTTSESVDGSPELVMERLIEKYSSFDWQHDVGDRETGSSAPPAGIIVLTGATGTLGVHLLAELARMPQVEQIVCLVRCINGKDPRQRVLQALGVNDLDDDQLNKVVAYTSDLDKPDLGLVPSVISHIRSSLRAIIHCAWPVNFNLGVQSFERTHIRGVHHLLLFAASAPRRAHFLFCSSVSVAARAPPHRPVPEGPIHDLSHCSRTGYAQSKLVSEHIVSNAAKSKGAPLCTVLRIGQIVGDRASGRWNDSEAIPLIIRSALTIHVMPRLEETCSWMPVDVLTRAIVELSGLTSPAADVCSGNSGSYDHLPYQARVFNLVNPHSFAWTPDLLCSLRAAGLSFTEVEPYEWLNRLRDASCDIVRNPAAKLLEFFQARYGSNDGMKKEPPRAMFDTADARAQSAAVREAPNVLREGHVNMFVHVWLQKWGVADTRHAGREDDVLSSQSD